jgi:hypothetical protein
MPQPEGSVIPNSAYRKCHTRGISKVTNLGIAIRYMNGLIATITCNTQGSNDISERAQTFIDGLGFP